MAPEFFEQKASATVGANRGLIRGSQYLHSNFQPAKNWFFPCKKYFPRFFEFCLPLFYVTFQCGPHNVFKKISNNFFTHENLEKCASKVAHNRPKTFFSQSSPGHSQQPKIDFSYHKYVPRLICFLICGFGSCFLFAYQTIDMVLSQHSCML